MQSIDTPEGVLAELERALAEYKAALVAYDKRHDEFNTHVVLVQDQAISIQFDNELNPVGTKNTMAHMATRMTPERARSIAVRIRNGNNVRGEAVHVKVAMQRAIGSLETLLADFRGRLQSRAPKA